EDGIRDATVTGVQTCALPISSIPPIGGEGRLHDSAGPPIFPSHDPVRGAGVEPALWAWKAQVLPLDYPRSVRGLDREYLSPSSEIGRASCRERVVVSGVAGAR